MTAHAMQGARNVCIAAGMDDYIAKPFTKEALLAVIRRWIGKRSSATDASLDGAQESTPCRNDSPSLSDRAKSN